MRWHRYASVGLLGLWLACAEDRANVTAPVNPDQPAMAVNGGVQGRVVSVFAHYDAGAPGGRVAMIMDRGARRALDDNRDRVVSVEMPEQQVAALRSLPWITRLTVQPTTVFPTADILPWGVDYTNADYVRTKYGDVGEGVRVATLDDGIDCNHPDLADVFAGGFDFVNMNADACVGGGHGTPVAGIIAAAANESGVIGMAPGVVLFSVRVCGGQGCTDAAIRDGLQWAIDNNIRVVNMSFGNCGQDLSQEVRDKLTAASNAGITLVGAAGNGPHSAAGCLATSPVAKPAAYSSVIAVTALFQNEAQPVDYQYGPEVDIAAPTQVVSARSGGGTETFGGTSAATPHVAGAAALVVGRGNFSEPSSVRNALQLWAKDLGTAGWDNHYGYGALRADWSTVPVAAVTAIAGPQTLNSAGNVSYTATIERGDAPILLRWRVWYVNSGDTTVAQTGWLSGTAFSYSWPSGNYTATVTATPLEAFGRIGFPGTISVVVCTNVLPVAKVGEEMYGMRRDVNGPHLAKGGCGGGPPPAPSLKP